jgi:hypothetical protein
MTRTMTMKEYLLEELNRRMREDGKDVELVFERPQPRLAEVVQLQPASQGPAMENDYGK